MSSSQHNVGSYCNTDHVSVLTRGQCYLVEKVPIILGVSPANPFYYKVENLECLLQFAFSSSDQVKLFMADVVSVHNYIAVGSKHPEKTARTKANKLKTKVQKAAKSCHFELGKVQYIDWHAEVEIHSGYTKQLEYVLQMYKNNDEFKKDVRDTTKQALTNLQKNRLDDKNSKEGEEIPIDLNEGVQYLLKELAFFLAIPSVYEGMDKFVYIYHQDWPVLEKLFDGYYDSQCRQSLGFVKPLV